MNILYERLTLILLVLVLLVMTWCMYDSYYVYSHALNDDILKYKPGQSDISPEDPPLSDDMVAWITLDGTNIDYPVMQGRDNVKYLNTDPFGKYSLSGSIFLDFRNSPDLSDDYSNADDRKGWGEKIQTNGVCKHEGKQQGRGCF